MGGLIKLRLRRDAGLEEARLAIELLLRVRLSISRSMQLDLSLPIGRLEGFDLQPRVSQVRRRVADDNAVRRVVQFKQRRAAVHELVVADRSRGSLRVRVVGALVAAADEIQIATAADDNDDCERHQRPAKFLEPCLAGGYGHSRIIAIAIAHRILPSHRGITHRAEARRPTTYRPVVPASPKLASGELSQNNSLATAKSPISAKTPKPTPNRPTIKSHIVENL